MGTGWEKVSPEKCMEIVSIAAGQKVKRSPAPKRFFGFITKQTKISDFLAAATEVEESAKAPKPKSREPQRHSTPVRKRIKRYEDLTTAKEDRGRSLKLK